MAYQIRQNKQQEDRKSSDKQNITLNRIQPFKALLRQIFIIINQHNINIQCYNQ